MRLTTQQINTARQAAPLFPLAAADVALTKSGETRYNGACPFCGEGVDRFHVYTDKGNGRFWCRHCQKRGDGLQYLMYKNGWKLPKAVDYVTGNPIKNNPVFISSMPSSSVSKSTPFDYETWRVNLEILVYQAIDCLAQNPELPAYTYLVNRGIFATEIGLYGLGWVDEWHTVTDDTKLPKGLILPRWGRADGLPIKAVNVYLSKVDHAKYGKRRFVKGSDSKTAFGGHLVNNATHTIWVTEGELDAALLQRFLPEGWQAISYGSATIRPNDLSIFNGRKVVVTMDNDEAGKKGMAKWLDILPSAKPANVPSTKDIGDYWKLVGGEGLLAWVDGVI